MVSVDSTQYLNTWFSILVSFIAVLCIHCTDVGKLAQSRDVSCFQSQLVGHELSGWSSNGLHQYSELVSLRRQYQLDTKDISL